MVIALVIAMFSGAVSVLAETSANYGTTYTFAGGSWGEPSSWNPQSLPGADDNVIIPAGLVATAPKSLDIGTLTVEGTINVSTIQLKTFEVKLGGQMLSDGAIEIDSRGSAKNTGIIISKGSLTLKSMGFENGGIVRIGGICDWKVLGTFTNTGTLESKGPILLQAAKIFNSGRIATIGTKANVAFWSFDSVENNGTIIGYSGLTGATGEGENGGSVYIACKSYVGNGAVAPGNGGNGNPPGHKGTAIIGSDYNPESFNGQAPPYGTILDQSTWNQQTGKASPTDGMAVGASVSNGLSLEPPTGSKLYRYGGFSVVTNILGGRVSTRLKWTGEGTVKIRGTCSILWANFSTNVTYLNPGESCPIEITFPQRPQSNEELKLTFETTDGKSYVSMKIMVFFVKCPIIEGTITSNQVRVTEDDGRVMNKSLSVAPTIVGNIVCVPLRDFIEINHGKVAWDKVSRSATVTMPGRRSIFVLGQKTAKTDGFVQNLDSSTFLYNGKLMVPAGSLASIIGASFRTDGKTYRFKYPG